MRRHYARIGVGLGELRGCLPGRARGDGYAFQVGHSGVVGKEVEPGDVGCCKKRAGHAECAISGEFCISKRRDPNGDCADKEIDPRALR
jgi:hypothetical protein